MACILGFLLAGVAYLAHVTHASPYVAGYPSVLSEVGRAVFGNGVVGNVLYILVQTATAAILFTGANTSFNGFPALASFVAEDRFLPRQLTKRGHRLVFSNGIIALTALSVVLLLVTGGSVNALVPFYAIGVFTGFSMAGYGMTKHHLTHREPGWRRRLAINLSSGILSTIVVGIFAVAKFTEGAWLVVVVFPLLVFGLMRLNREYRAEAAILEMFRTDRPELVKYARHKVFVFVNSVDLAVLEALRKRIAGGRTDRGAFHGRRGPCRAVAKALGSLRTRYPAAGCGLPGSAGHPGRAGAGREGARRTSEYQRDRVIAASNIRAAAGTAAA
jgi:amino acid transporter